MLTLDFERADHEVEAYLVAMLWLFLGHLELANPSIERPGEMQDVSSVTFAPLVVRDVRWSKDRTCCTAERHMHRRRSREGGHG